MKRRILALFLAVVMTVGVLPVNAFAAETEETYEYTESVSQEEPTECVEQTEAVTEEATEPSAEQTQATEEAVPEETEEETLPEETEEETVPEETEEATVPAETEEATIPAETEEATIPEETVEETTEEPAAETEEVLFSSPIITTVEELAAVSLGEYDHYLLAADLELPADWESIDLYGSFDANGYTVTLNGQPLFGTVAEGAVVSNVILYGSVRADYAGSLAVNCSGEIRNSVSFAQVESTADWADNGGFVYHLDGGSVINCLFMGAVADDEDTDGYGIAAKSTDGSVSSCGWLEAELPMWDEDAQNSRQVSWEEAVTTAFLNERNGDLGEDDLLWGLNEDGEPVPGGQEPGVEPESEEPEEAENLPQRQLITVMLDESAPYASPFDPDASVVVTVEGHTLSHGFYIEPTVVSFDEFVSYWAGKGVPVAKEDITAGGMIDYVIYQNGFSRDRNPEPAVFGAGYMSGADGIRKGKGDAKVPACLADDGITIEQVEGDDLYEFDYTSGGGWMFTEGNWLSNQAMGSHRFSQFGTLHTVNGQNYYVVRLQFTIAGLGADLGFVDWGNSYGYVAADKSDLYIEYATLGADAAAKQEALAVMTQLDATQEEVDAATAALWDAAHAEEPEFIVNLNEEPVTYEFGTEAEPLVIEAAVSEGRLSYAWYSSTDMVNWTKLACTDSELIPATDRTGTVYYKCVVTNDDGTGMASVAESNVATVICGVQTPVFTTNLSTDEVSYLTIDTAAPLAVETAVTDGGTVTYQWYLSADKETWTAIDGAVGTEYVPDVTVTGTTYYKCTATNTMDGSESSADSAFAMVTVRVDTPAFDTDLRTTTHYIQLDESYTLSVEASIRDGGELSYQWYSGSDSSFDRMAPIDGATEASYTVTDTDQPGGLYYRVKVTNTLGSETAEAVSNWTAVKAMVCNPAFEDYFGGTDLPREKTYQLNDADAQPMTVEAVLHSWDLEGELRGTITYQWYVSEDRYGTYEMIPGATGNSYTPDLTTAGYRYYRCEATNTVENSKGEVFTASDDSRTVAVRVVGSEIPEITIDLPSGMEYTLEQADAQPLTIEVTPVSDGGTLSYQWYYRAGDSYGTEIDYNMTAIEGATEASYTPDLSVGGTNQYACRVTNTLNGQQTSTDSEVCKVTVNCAYPEITLDLEEQTYTYVEGDEGATLSVEAKSTDGGELSYQWFNGSNAIDGATESAFTIPTDEPGTYSYSVEVTNSKSGAVRSVKSTAVTVKVTAIQKEITTEEELRNMRPNGSYLLMNDIELTQKWNPINNFSGILDGNGHTISKVSVPEGAGFFTTTQAGAEIRNLSLNGRISRAGSGDIGGLVGKVEGDTVISGCHVDLAVVGEQTNNAGGIVGNASGSCLIENSYYTGVLRGQNSGWAYSGGIIGNKTNGVIIKNCYTTNDKLVGNYGWFGVDASTLINNYSALGDSYTTAIPEDLSTFHELLGDAYAEDRANINRGYPILQWEYVPADKSALNEAIAQAEALEQELYTVESWAALISALDAANLVAAEDDPTKNAVDAACEALYEAIANLERRPVDKTGLEADVAKAKKVDQKLYTEESWSAFAKALKNAEEILADEEALQSEVNQARESLKQAMEHLVVRPADKAELKKAIAHAGTLKEADYTPASWKKLSEALANASRVDADEKALQTAVDSALKALNEAIAALEKKAELPDLSEAYKATANYLKKQTPIAGQTVGGEWSVLGLMRSDYQPDSAYQKSYYNKAVAYVREQLKDRNDGRLDNGASTDNSRMVVALTSLGIDATDVGGYNLLTALTDMKYLKKQGLNGPIWALIAFDTKPYDIPGSSMTREILIDHILNSQLPEGGWNRSAGNPRLDVDITGMALYALAPYYEDNAQVREAVDQAVARLSSVQSASGGFVYGIDETMESCAQIIVGLSSLGIDAHADKRFVKDGNSVIDAFLSYYAGGGEFKHTLDGEADFMSTEQALYAMAAYFRNLNGKNRLYDMSDIHVEDGGDSGDGGDNTETADKSALEAAIRKAEGLKESDYTKKSWAAAETALKEMLAEAKNVLRDSNATQAQVDAAAKALNDIMGKLVKNTDDNTENVDKSALKAAIQKAEGLKESDYTKKSWAAVKDALKEKLTNAKTVLDNSNATQAQVDAAAKALNDLVGKLVKNTGSNGSSGGSGSTGNKGGSTGSKVNRTKLDAEVKKAEKLKKDDYTAQSWKVFETALTNAKNALKSTKATQKQIDEAYSKLVAAEKALKKATIEDSRSKLEAEIKESEKLAEEDYTAKSWKSFASALDSAKKVLKNDQATQKQLEDAYTKLAAAKKALKQASGDSRTKLDALVKKCADLVETNYTAESWEPFAEALRGAKAVLENKDADDKQLDDARAALNAAGRALIPVDGAPEAGGGIDTQTLLIVLVIVQAVIICALAGWFLLKRKRT